MRLATAILCLLLAACAPMEWYRPDMSAGDTEHDAHECADMAWRTTSWNYPYYYGAFGRAYWGPWASPYNDRFIQEARMADYCMQAKGYRLEPTQK